MAEPRLEHQTVKIRQLIEDYRSGRIVTPEFQREYVWKPSKAPLLIDSLYQGFPISSLLLWQSSEPVRPRRKEPYPNRSGAMSWLIDGQQRVITLARTMSGDEGIDVVFNPDEEKKGARKFQLSNAATNRDPSWVRIAELWDDESYRRLRRNLDGTHFADKREARFERIRRILDYEVPIVRMIDHSFEDAVSAFRCINTLGVRLKQQDIESAKVAAQHSGFIADEVVPFLEKVRLQGFSRINIMHIFRACAFVARPDERKKTPLHELGQEEMLEAWRRTKRATEDAMGLIRSELHLVNMDILWSGFLLVPVIAMCATLKPKESDPRGIAGWIALATLLHRYSGATETALDQDLNACRSSDPLGALLKNLRQVRPKLKASEDDFGGALMDRSGLLASYFACLHRGVLDFFTGRQILLQNNVDRHHILPRNRFLEAQRSKSDCIANIAFIGGGTNKSIGHSEPEVYLDRIDAKILRSQCIPEDRSLWPVDRSEDFWKERRRLLARAFNEYVHEALKQRRL